MNRRAVAINLLALGLLLALVAGLALAQGPEPTSIAGIQADLGTGFTYQGRLMDGDSLAGGEYDFSFVLYDAETGGSQVGSAETPENVSVTDGLFTVVLDFGSGAFDGQARWLEIGVRPGESTGDYTTFDQRQALTATPYALHARTAPWAGLTGVPAGFADGADDDELGGLSCGNGQVAKWNSTLSQWQCGDDQTGAVGDFWSLTGNTGTTAANFLGTTDNQALELRVNNARALRLEPNAASPNIIAGYSGNSVTPGTGGATVGGGGTGGHTNHVTYDFGTVGGGVDNTASGYAATIAGGRSHTASGDYASIGGGHNITVTTHYATVAGGGNNTASGYVATVGGGWGNDASHHYTTVSGGYLNHSAEITATIGGGEYISVSGMAATVAGGSTITVTGDYGAVGGGRHNSVSGNSATVGGGRGNTADNWYATTSGGLYNVASGDSATVGGGQNNTADGKVATVGGGESNTASSRATVSGGFGNEASGWGATIGGGYNITVTAECATVGGGAANEASHNYATIGGGEENTASGLRATVGGGYQNDSSYNCTTIGGGRSNTAANECATVGGGADNDVIGGYATVSGGWGNSASGWEATAGGGGGNSASGWGSTVPGGADNTAQGSYSFAAGRRAKANHEGSFVLTDSTDADFASVRNDALRVRFNGGATFSVNDGYWVRIWHSGGALIDTSNGAYLSEGGTWTNSSDRDSKENFAPVEGHDLLARLAEVPIQTWNYKAEDPSVRHIGPVAQDFQAAFGLGEDDEHISTVDAEGVALAAIQALYQQNQALAAENAAQQAQIADLEARMAALEQAGKGKDAPLRFAPGWLFGGLLLAGLVVGGRWRARGGKP